MKKKLPPLIQPGDICLGVVRDGQLNIGGGFLYKAPLKPGKYIVTSFGNDSLLLMQCTSESCQLLSEVSRGICLSDAPFHIQAHILRPSRIPSQNRNAKKTPIPSNTTGNSRKHIGNPRRAAKRARAVILLAHRA
ncbi:MAG: hypothetical protein LBB81_06380 [Treponema sp.]|nr:hypothetical protein [Treponema sp.]